MGLIAVRQQPHGRARVPGTRPRTRNAGPHRIPDEPTAHVRHLAASELLTSHSDAGASTRSVGQVPVLQRRNLVEAAGIERVEPECGLADWMAFVVGRESDRAGLRWFLSLRVQETQAGP